MGCAMVRQLRVQFKQREAVMEENDERLVVLFDGT
jgi:hypothetical protein